MRWFGDLMGGLADGFNAVTTYLGFKEQQKVNDLNYNMQKDELAYQKDLQKLMFAREDNAVQRRVNDLKAAGLSPTLAAGSSASAGPVVSTQTPQKLSNLNGYLALAQVGTMLANQQKARTEADIAKQQLKQVELDNKYYENKGVAPIEVNQDWKQRLVNLLYPKLEDMLFGDVDKKKPGIVQKVITALNDGKENPFFGDPKVPTNGSTTKIPYKAFPYEIPRVTTAHGSLTDREYYTLKNAGLLDVWYEKGFKDDRVFKALARNGR